MSNNEFGDIEIFKGKKMSELFEDIYNNSKNRRESIDDIVNILQDKLNSLRDAIMIAPIIQEFLGVAVTNDEQLIKLATVLQRLITSSKSAGEDDGILTTKEREKLKEVAAKTIDEIRKDADNIETRIKEFEVDNVIQFKQEQ